MRSSILLALIFLIAAVLPAHAQTHSPWVGNAFSNPNGATDSIRDCPSGFALTGFNLSFGKIGIGQLRGVCSRIDEHGMHTGDKAHTTWTSYNWGDPNNEQNEFYSLVQCPNNMVSRSFRARTNSTGAYIYGLHFSCKVVNTNDLYALKINDSGSYQELPSIGSNHGSWQDWKRCPNRELATGFEVRSLQTLTRLRMRCGTPGAKVSAPQPFSLTGPNYMPNFADDLTYTWTPPSHAQSYMVIWATNSNPNPENPATYLHAVACDESPCTPELSTADFEAIAAGFENSSYIFVVAFAVSVVENKTGYTRSRNEMLLNPPRNARG